MSDTRVLVTGATGFLGRSLVPCLAREGFACTAASRSGDAVEGACDRLVCDLRDWTATRDALQPWRWDAVVHLAGPAPKGLWSWEEGVVLVTAHLRTALHVRAAVPTGWLGRFVHASGMIVYGLPETVPVPEAHPRRPLHAYGLAKVVAEDAILAGEGLDRWILRLPGLFSADRREGALHAFMAEAREGRPLRITAKQPLPWDVLHVDDAVDAIVCALRAPGSDPGPINVSYGDPVDLVHMAHRVATLAGTGSEVENAGGATHPSFTLEVSKAQRWMGWDPPELGARLQSLWDHLAWS